MRNLRGARKCIKKGGDPVNRVPSAAWRRRKALETRRRRERRAQPATSFATSPILLGARQVAQEDPKVEFVDRSAQGSNESPAIGAGLPGHDDVSRNPIALRIRERIPIAQNQSETHRPEARHDRRGFDGHQQRTDDAW